VLVRRRVVVTGHVQGVWFREACRREALSVGVAGWIRNRSDATVEAVFEGDSPGVAAMVAWCRTGPPAAEVSGVDVFEEQPTGERSFTVRR
jgi:acylphosphatase